MSPTRKPPVIKSGKVRVAIIGAGSMMNAAHAPSLAGMKDVELVALSELIPEKAQATAARFAIPKVYQDYRKMLDETKPQAVYALMPPHQLYDVAIDIISRSLDLFIEKPPAVTVFQAECLARLAQEKKIVSGVGFQRRYHPLFQRCYQEVRKYGPLHQIVGTFYKNLAPAVEHPYYRGAIDILTSDAIHIVDAIRFYAGGEVQAVASDIRTLDSWYNTVFNALITFDNGVTGIQLANWRTGKRRLALELHATGCSAYVDADGVAEVFAENKGDPILRLTHTEAAGSEAMHAHQGFLAQARAFIDAVKTRQPLHNCLADAVKSMRLCEAIYAGAINRK